MELNMQTQEFLFVRHGQTRWNVERRLQGRSDVPLNETGLEQARECAGCLVNDPIAAIVTSPLQRAHQTALSLAEQTEASVTVDDKLIERSFGEYEGRIVEEVRPADVTGVDFCALDLSEVGAEPWAEVCARALSCVETWTAAHPKQKVLFVSHYGIFIALCQTLLGTTVSAKNAVPYRFVNDKGWRLEELAAGPVKTAGVS